MADSHDQHSGFWTLTRQSKLSKRRNSDLHELHHKVFNIGVVGLSGVEKDRGPIGIGKSCLCNRFVRSAADDYHTDHISILSQSDFSGRVVNNDHWLYWGSVIKSCDGYDLAFNVIEQTEFIDDVCFQPFKSGKTEPYYKRCANTKIVSPEKLMYICKSQLGIEREYEQRYLPDGKFTVDGFLCLFDVSEVQGRSIDKQIEITNLIMLNLLKTKKPIVFVTTKHDEASEMLVAEAERLINQRDFRGVVPIVETSAQENVNVNMAFLVCAQLIDRTRAKLRIPPFFEAHKNHMELLIAAEDAYLGLIRSTVIDYRSSWQQVCMKLSHNPEFLQYTYLNGLDKAAQVFNNHVRSLHEECINHKMQIYLKTIPDILNEIIPIPNHTNDNNNDTTSESNKLKELCCSSPQAWEMAKEYIRCHPLFKKYFITIPDGLAWYETELLQTNETRIPSDLLNSEEIHSIFHQRNVHYEAEQKRQSSKQVFAQMLSDLKVPVGQPFVEVKHIFSRGPNLEFLNDQELFEIYVEYQNNLLQKARADFQELLLENAEHLQHLTSSDKVIRQEDIKTINAVLQHDERYQALDRFDQDRTLMMIRHLSFLHSQMSEQCPSYPKCIEPDIERLLITKAKALVSKFYEGKPEKTTSLHSQKSCDLVIFGPRRPSQQLMLALNVLNSRTPKNSQYQITFTVFDNPDDIDGQIQRFKQSSDAKPSGCFGIFTNGRSLEHLSYTVEKFLTLNAQTQNNHFGGPPIVMLYAADITLDERTMLALENEGQQLADRFKCPFMNVTAIDQYRQHQQNNLLNNEQDSTSQVMSECASLDYACIDAAFNVLKEAISRRVCFIELYNNQELIPRQAFNPDARILMCLLCGEPFSNELFLWKMFLDYENCYVTSSKSICFRVRQEDCQDKFIEVTITSYTHGAFNYKEDLLHGFILVCSTERKASLAILNAFSFNIPCTPVLVLAVSSGQSTSFLEVENLFEDAKDASNRLKGHFDYVDLSGDQMNLRKNLHGIERFRKFLQNAIDRKPAIERAYEAGDNDIGQFSLQKKASQLTDDIQKKFSSSEVTDSSSRTKHKRKYKVNDDSINVNGCNEKSFNPVGSDDIPKTVSRTLLHLNRQQGEYQQKSQNRPSPIFSERRFVRKTETEAHQLHGPIPLEFQTRQQNQPNELYAKRPLPPIPASTLVDRQTTNVQYQQDVDREVELSEAPTSSSLSVSELNSPYESDSEQAQQQHSHNFLRGHSEFSKESSGFIRNSSIDSSDLINSRGATIRQLNEILANKQPPGRSAGQRDLLNKGCSLDQPDQQESPLDIKKVDKDTKKDKKKIRSNEKLEKRKLKEEERLRRQEEEKQRRQEKKLASKKSKSSSAGSNSVGDDGIPFFIKRCIEYIESEGLDAEGIYRVPGNRAHVDAFVQKFKENQDMSIVESDIPVNAVATALKDFLSKKWGPIIPLNLMNELTELSNITEKDRRIEAVRQLVEKLPAANYNLLKYVISHFVRVSLNHSLNSMDSKNLAICWWPTLLPLHFNDMVMFEQMRPHLEESIQTMIDQYNFIFQDENPKATIS